uniref:Uncharacterized protein n=1 Tax=Phytophthora ramorum TaxID=164328 RepID=H3GD47_PHYRM
MRACLVFSALLATTWIAQVEAVACAEICYTTELTGFAPGGTPGCTCSGSTAGARAGAGDCNCGQCYEETQGLIIGFAINSDGTCTYGTDCGNCELVSRSPTSSSTNPPTNTTSTPTPVPATSAPSSGSSSSTTTSIGASASEGSAADSSSSATASSSESGSSNSNSKDKVGNSAGSKSGSKIRDEGLSLWQIVLAICCTVLIFMVAVVSVFACYCKARSRLYEHEEDQASYYNQVAQQTPSYQPWVPNRTAQPADSKSNIV